ncbi:hypothetical protein Q3G72_006204 [Acer saccharum]|nr:hypothetical protein Q3G72_006204 [Acer saccharum]
MAEWKESLTSESRLRWVDAVGVPLSCWSKEFFMHIGGKVGESMMVEEDTVKRTRVDRGRILVWAAVDKKIMEVIQVRVGRRFFPIRLEEVQEKVDSDWLQQVLGLRSRWKVMSDVVTEPIVFLREKEGSKWMEVDKRQSQTVGVKSKEKDSCCGRKADPVAGRIV